MSLSDSLLAVELDDEFLALSQLDEQNIVDHGLEAQSLVQLVAERHPLQIPAINYG